MKRGADLTRMAVAGEAHAPESQHRLGKFQLYITADAAIVLGFHYLADDFLFCFFVRQEKKLSWRDRQ